MTTQEQAQWVLAWVLALLDTHDINDFHHTVGTVLTEHELDDPQDGRLTPVASAAVGALDRAGFYRAPTARAIRRAIRQLDGAGR